MKERIPLQEQLLQFGPLPPEAWQAIMSRHTLRQVPPSKALPLPSGSIIYVKKGLVKQYDHRPGKDSAINRFLRGGQFLFCPSNTQGIYAKSIHHSILWYWEETAIRQTMQQYPYLFDLYRPLYTAYAHLLDVRLQIMESHGFEKIQLFDQHFPELRLYLKKQDLARYIGINKTYLSNLL